MDETINSNAVATAAELGKQANSVEVVYIENTAKLPGVPDEIPAIVMHGASPVVLSLDYLFNDYRLVPERKTGTAHTASLASFISLTNRHKTNHSAVFAATHWKAPSLTAVINYHRIDDEQGIADYLDHKIAYTFPLSEEWQAWQEQDGNAMQQSEFSAFIEDRIADLAAPEPEELLFASESFSTTMASPAKMIELSRGLQVNVDSQVKNATTLQSGEAQITYTETHNGADGKPIQVPGMFMLRIAPFVNGEIVRVPVRLRYRAKQGSIIWFYQIYRPDQAINSVVSAAIKTVSDETGLPVYEGKPEQGNG